MFEYGWKMQVVTTCATALSGWLLDRRTWPNVGLQLSGLTDRRRKAPEKPVTKPSIINEVSKEMLATLEL